MFVYVGISDRKQIRRDWKRVWEGEGQ